MQYLIASPYTRFFWYEYQLDRHRCDYNIVFRNHIQGALDVERLSVGLSRFLKDYDLFNRRLTHNSSGLVWAQAGDKQSREALLEVDSGKVNDFIRMPFNLERGCLCRFGLVRLGDAEYQFIIVAHHALLDGSQFDQIISEISRYYNDDFASKEIEERCNKSQQEFLQLLYHQQGERVKRLVASNSKNIWARCLGDDNVTNGLPYLRSVLQSDHDNLEVGMQVFKVSETLINELRDEFSISVFNLLLVTWGVLMGRHMSSSSYVSYPVAMEKNVKSNIYFGAMINTCVLKVSRENSKTFEDIINQCGKTLEGLVTREGDIVLKHTQLPVTEILDGRANQKLNLGFAQTNLRKMPVNFEGCRSHVIADGYVDIYGYELLLEYQKFDSVYFFRLKYRDDLFSSEQVSYMAEQYADLLRKLLHEGARAPINEIAIISQEEYQRMLMWNATEKSFLGGQTVSQLFERQACKTPDRKALFFENNSLTYKELNDRSNQLAHHILEHYWHTSSVEDSSSADCLLVGICLDRSLEIIIAILAVLKLGAAYVPIDTTLPDFRVDFILKGYRN
ncbi:condensation domain-containing protein [Cysteiniphilum litorale]|uniref:condensation domain-containing protein n=1 Tax=Cysteiniphilum litorale TaxID=2056700 RepID=UPI003F8812D8